MKKRKRKKLFLAYNNDEAKTLMYVAESYQELAEFFGCTVGAIRTAFYRGFKVERKYELARVEVEDDE